MQFDSQQARVWVYGSWWPNANKTARISWKKTWARQGHLGSQSPFLHGAPRTCHLMQLLLLPLQGPSRKFGTQAPEPTTQVVLISKGDQGKPISRRMMWRAVSFRERLGAASFKSKCKHQQIENRMSTISTNAIVKLVQKNAKKKKNTLSSVLQRSLAKHVAFEWKVSP